MKLDVVEVIENLHVGITLSQFTRLLLAKTVPKNTRFNLLMLLSAWFDASKQFQELSDGIAAAYHWLIYCATNEEERKNLAEERWQIFVGSV